jgi:hypothetical protein
LVEPVAAKTVIAGGKAGDTAQELEGMFAELLVVFRESLEIPEPGAAIFLGDRILSDGSSARYAA